MPDIKTNTMLAAIMCVLLEAETKLFCLPLNEATTKIKKDEAHF
jgi:hypothetical protein